MAKILLVEDDNNLREIFEMRLKAEGYTIVSAHDGEEALVVAMKEKPDLVISDVMMPKLSGFEMIETLKASPEMKNVKVIMMTALGQAEDRAQGDKLGVNRYLVKSQVTLEDFVKVTHEVLEGSAPPPPPPAPAPATTPDPSAPRPAKVEPAKPEPVSTPLPVQDVPPILTQAPPPPAPAPTEAPTVASAPNPGAQQSEADELAAVEQQIKEFVETSQEPAGNTSAPENNNSQASPSSGVPHEKVIKPLDNSTPEPDITAIAAKEEAEQHKDDPVVNPPTGAVLATPPKADDDDGPAAGPVVVQPPEGVDATQSPEVPKPQTGAATPGATINPNPSSGGPASSDPNAVAL